MSMIRTPIPNNRRLMIGIISVLFIIVGYFSLAYYQSKANPDNTTIPTVKLFVEGFKNIFTPRVDRIFLEDGTVKETMSFAKSWFVMDSLSTASRLGLSLSISIVTGTLLGILMGCFASIEAFFNWPLSFFSKIAPTAALGVFFILFGTDMEMFVAMITFGITPAIAISTMLAVKQVPEQIIHKSYTIGSSTCETIYNVVFMYILPNIIDAIRLAVGPAIVYLIAAESLCADSGFGYRIRMQAKLTNMNTVFIYIIILAVFGFLVDWGLKKLQKKLCKWYASNRT